MIAKRDGNHIRICDAYQFKESIKEIPGNFFDRDNKAWVVPFSKENATTLALLGAILDDDLRLEEPMEAAGDEDPILPMLIKARPYQHQVRAYNFALRAFGIGGAG